MRLSSEWQGEGHEESGDADLEGGKLAGGDSMRRVSQGQEVAGEGDRAAEGEQVSEDRC